MASSPNLIINHISDDFPISRLDDMGWERASQVLISTYWSGLPAQRGREFASKILWSDSALYVRFDASQGEPLVIADNPDLSKKTLGLWDRDVCEIFIAPDASRRDRYFEFEVAPTGEWVDLAIENASQKRVTDLAYDSGMTVAARIEPGRVMMAIKIPWIAFGMRPRIGDVWLGNIFRCVGLGEDRGYLAWSPTKTVRPNFHVPEKFGEFEFVSEPPTSAGGTPLIQDSSLIV